jgi:hypothetical protein
MANLIWTGILYFTTLAIVYIAYKTFINDRKYENELKVTNQVRIAQGLSRKDAAVAAAASVELVAAPGEKAPAAVQRFAAPARSARSNTIPANIRRA